MPPDGFSRPPSGRSSGPRVRASGETGDGQSERTTHPTRARKGAGTGLRPPRPPRTSDGAERRSRLRLRARLLDPDRRLDRVLAAPVRRADEAAVPGVEAD